MKKLLLIVVCAIGSLLAVSQTNLTQAVDFTVTFTDGTEFNLFDKLAEDKYVVVDWFFTTCGPCQANQPYYTQAFHNFGCNESDEIYFLSVENTVGDAAVIAYEENYAGEPAPPAASGTEGGGIEAENLYNISAFPTFILIAPDGSIVEQDMWPLTNGADTFTEYFESHGISQMVCTTSVEETSENLTAAVYPIPANQSLNVKLTGFTGKVQVTVFNLVGELVYSAQTSDLNTLIDVSAWSAGNYVMTLQDDDQTIRRSVSVIH
jgi:thiol-disulfide isomerase/thioredoxin